MPASGRSSLTPTEGNSSSRTVQFLKRHDAPVATAISSLISTLVGFPFDTVKSRMQSYPFRNSFHCALDTWKVEGFRGFFRGSLAPLFSVSLVRSVSMTTYLSVKDLSGPHLHKILSRKVASTDSNRKLPSVSMVATFATAGMISGAATSFIAAPFETVKTYSQLDRLMRLSRAASLDDPSHLNLKPKGSVACGRAIVQARGISGLFIGLPLHCARDMLGTGIFFTVYESTKMILLSSDGLGLSNAWAIAASGGLCGLTSWLCVFPLDSILTRYRRDSLKDLGRPRPQLMLMRNSFFDRRNYRGLGVSMTRSCILNLVFFSCFESLRGLASTA